MTLDDLETELRELCLAETRGKDPLHLHAWLQAIREELALLKAGQPTLEQLDHRIGVAKEQLHRALEKLAMQQHWQN